MHCRLKSKISRGGKREKQQAKDVRNSSGANSKRNRAAFDVSCDDRVGAYPGMRPDFDGSKDLGAGSNVDMVTDPGNSGPTSSADRNLLEDQAIDPNLGLWVNHDAVGMGDQKASPDATGQGDVRTRDRAPKSMPQHQPFPQHIRRDAVSALPALIASYRCQ